MVAFDSPHELPEVGCLCSWVWQTVLQMPGVDSGKVELNRLWFVSACKIYRWRTT